MVKVTVSDLSGKIIKVTRLMDDSIAKDWIRDMTKTGEFGKDFTVKTEDATKEMADEAAARAAKEKAMSEVKSMAPSDIQTLQDLSDLVMKMASILGLK